MMGPEEGRGWRRVVYLDSGVCSTKTRHIPSMLGRTRYVLYVLLISTARLIDHEMRR